MSGTIADRVERPRLLFGVAGAAAVLMALLSWLSSAGNIQTWQVAAIALATGCQQVFDTPAPGTRDGYGAEGSGDERGGAECVRHAIGDGNWRIHRRILIPTVGVSRCYLVVAGVYVLSGTLMSTLRVARGTRAAASIRRSARRWGMPRD